MRVLLLLLLVFSTLFINAQRPESFDFETIEKTTRLPVGIQIETSADYKVSLDSLNAYSGKYCIKIEKDSSIKGETLGGSVSFLIPNYCQGETLRLEAFIKTESISKGWASIWIQTDGLPEFDKLKRSGIKGSNDWKMYSIEIPVKKGVSAIRIGAMMNGYGRMWIDQLHLFHNGNMISLAHND